MDQERLWQESLREALKSTIDRLGGPKVVGHTFWPTMNPEDAGQKLSHILDATRREKLEIDEFEALFKLASGKNCHLAMTYLCEAANYEPPRPVSREKKLAELQEKFASAVADVKDLAQRMEAFK